MHQDIRIIRDRANRMLQQSRLPKVSKPVYFCGCVRSINHPSSVELCAMFVIGLRAELERILTASLSLGRMK